MKILEISNFLLFGDIKTKILATFWNEVISKVDFFFIVESGIIALITTNDYSWTLRSTYQHLLALSSTQEHGSIAPWALLTTHECSWHPGAMLSTHECSWGLMRAQYVLQHSLLIKNAYDTTGACFWELLADHEHYKNSWLFISIHEHTWTIISSHDHSL